jgi:hypothetical protein
MSQQKTSVGKIIGFTCLGMIAVPILIGILTTLAFTGGGGFSSIFGGLFQLLFVGAIVLIIIRLNKRNKSKVQTYQSQMPSQPQAVVQPSAAVSNESLDSAIGYETSVCSHIFTEEGLKDKEYVSCHCGYSYSVKNLREYKALSKKFAETQKKLVLLERTLLAEARYKPEQVSTAPVAQPVAQTAARSPRVQVPSAPIIAQQSAAPVVKPQVTKRKRAALSAQQWLVMGASAITVMAGSAFVSTNISTLKSEQFLMVTLGVGIVTGFLAFWGRKFSVMLSNFMATFSSAMQMFSLLIIGDMFNEFAWDSAPAWWWSIVLLVVSGVAFVLARFKANFGWKLISILGLLGSAFALIFGPIDDLSETGSQTFGWKGAACTVAAVAIALITKRVITYQYIVPKDSQDSEYEKDLATRENAVLNRFSPVGSGMLLGWGLGYVLFGLVANLVDGIEPLSFTAFAVVWVLAGAFQEKWISVLAPTEALQKKLNFWQHIVGFVSLALALSSWIAYLSALNVWVGVVGSSVLFFAAALLVTKVKRVAAHSIALMISQFAVLASYLFWYAPVQTSTVALPAISCLLLMFGLSLALEHWLRFSVRALLTALISNAVGVFLLAINMRANPVVDISSVGFALTALGLILLSVVYSPLLAMANARHKKEFSSVYNYLILGLTALVSVVLVFPGAPISDVTLYLNLILLAFVTAAVTGLVAVSVKKLPAAISSLLRTYGYVYQGVFGLLLLFSVAYSANAAVIAICIAGLALLNYALAWLGKRQVEGWLGYGLALISLLMALTAQLPYWQISAHLALAIGASLVIAIAHNLVTKRAGLGSVPFVSYAVCFAFALFSYLMNLDTWRNGQRNDQVWIGLAEVLAIAIGGALLAERKGVKSETALRVNSLAYLVFGFFGFANVEFISLLMIGELRTTSPYLREMIVSFVFAVIAIRQLSKVSRTEDETATNSWFALSYVGPLVTAVFLPMYIQYWLPQGTWLDELSPIPFVLALAIPTFFNHKIAKSKRALTALDIPVLVLLFIQIAKAATAGLNTYEGLDRVAIVLTLAAVFAYWRSSAEKQIAWVFGGFISGGLAAVAIGSEIQTRLLPNLVVPELYTVLLSLSLVAGSRFFFQRAELKESIRTLVRVDIPVLLPVVVSIGYSMTQDLLDVLNVSRLLVSVLVFTGYARWKLGANKIMAWAALSYLGTIGSGLVLVRLLYIFAPGIWSGPEIMSIALAGAVFFGNQGLTKVREFKSSVITHGLPFATLMVPSIIYSYSALSDSFDLMAIDQLVRIFTLIVIALASFVLGMRGGNLGISIVGGSSLALMVLPISWVRAGDTADASSTVSLRAVVIAAFLWALFALLRRVKAIPGTSYIYLGIPIGVALVPTLFLTIQALGNPELTSVDWWRFGITVCVSLVLLIIGSLRGLGGLFFPGLVGVFLGVLPYAFKPIASRSWFLWMILLAIAAVMIWIAVRLEQMRKVGKSSISWVKALK